MDRERRRDALLRRRAGLTAGAVAGAAAMLGGGTAQASNMIEVTSKADGPVDWNDPAMTLREAFYLARQTADNEGDTITFKSTVTGTIRLTEGELTSPSGLLTIDGPGASVLTISGDADGNGTGDTRILNVPGHADPTIEGVTLADGKAAQGGALFVAPEAVGLTVQDSVLSGNTADSGGAIFSAATTSEFKYRPGLTITTVTSTPVTVIDSELRDNHATSGSGGAIKGEGQVRLERSLVEDNTSSASGGGIAAGGVDGWVSIFDSTVSGNAAQHGGGIAIEGQRVKYEFQTPHTIERTTVAGNTASGDGGGLVVPSLKVAEDVDVSQSTFSGNEAAGAGGGIALGTGGAVHGPVDIGTTTISGNKAAVGGGLSVGGSSAAEVQGLVVRNATIASNVASTRGGGVSLNAIGPVAPAATLTSTVIADNTAAGTAEDVDRPDAATSGGFDGAFSLVEAPGDGLASSASTVTGQDPKLGALAENGGPTKTHLPAVDSALIDAGKNPDGGLPEDQRRVARTIDAPAANAADGTDIGAVERDDVAPKVTAVSLPNVSPTGADAVQFAVTFDETVTGGAVEDFALAKTGSADGTIASVTGSGATRTVLVNDVVGNGTLRLDVLASNAIKDVSGNALAAGFTTGDAYTIDNGPLVQSVDRVGAELTNDDAVDFVVKFDEEVKGVDATDFAVHADGVTGAAVTGVSGSGDTRTVRVGTGAGDGTLRLDALDDDTILDVGDKPLEGAFARGQRFTLDRTAPVLAINQAGDQADPTSAAAVRFTVVASEAVTGLEASDVVLGGTAGASKASLAGSGSPWTVEASGMTKDGTVVASVAAGAVEDAAGNKSVAGKSTDNSVAWTNPVRPVAPATPAAPAAPAVTSPVPLVAPLTCARVPTLEGHTLAYARRVLALDGCTAPLVIDNPKDYADTRLVVTRQAPAPGTPRAGTQSIRVIVKRKPAAKPKARAKKRASTRTNTRAKSRNS